MASASLPRRFTERLLAHLQIESDVLQRISALTESVTAGGISAPELSTRQSELASVANDAALLQSARQNLRQDLALELGCAPEDVRLSRVRLEHSAATQTFQHRRGEVAGLAVRAAAGLRTAENTLQGWSGIIGFVLGEVLITPAGAERYSAKGQRVSASPQIGIELRS
jgi:hypothetical protein